MELLRDGDIDMAPLAGKRVAILGYGNQGRAQALNLKDSGVDVVVGLRGASGSARAAEEAGLEVALVEEAAGSADLVMFLAPDEALGGIYKEVEARIRYGGTIGFSHGLAIHFGTVRPRHDLDVVLIAPKGPGTALRSLYQQGKGMVALWAVAQNATGNARSLALAYGKAIGCARTGLIASSFAEECEADLFNEGAVAGGGASGVRRRVEAYRRADRATWHRGNARSDLEHGRAWRRAWRSKGRRRRGSAENARDPGRGAQRPVREGAPTGGERRLPAIGKGTCGRPQQGHRAGFQRA
jgi:ketol-acid reductoisomerase